ncbi:cysteine dioxygenase family protein [Rhodanobacter sp. L36]|uniref:cysteine dioxygenase n=1 Tax=Rhodanobacter sp. L36 TaxID=1747221 RepID=UPI00131E314B|nr:cysteine dioxygenase family protein [Rhodanobacter sp. L36]
MTLSPLEIWRAAIARVLIEHQPRLPHDLDALCASLTAVTDHTDSRRALSERAAQIDTSYRRWLVAEGDGYSAILIGWPAGYQTPVHDHDGLWGIELVLCGALHVDEFKLMSGQQPSPVRTLDLTPDHAAVFDEAAYAHACSNPSASVPALSLHVYGGPLQSYSVYPPTSDELPRRQSTNTEPL